MRTKIGTVTSAKMMSTVTVTVHRYVMHPKYEKRFRRSKKFLADTNGMEVGEGDEVLIVETRPLSKRKCFKVTEIKKKAVKVDELKTDDVEGIARDHRDASYEKTQKEQMGQRGQKSSVPSATSATSVTSSSR